jgi:hypothetical protein
VAAIPAPVLAQSPDFTRSVRDLDGAQFLEDEPIWVCDAGAGAPAVGSGLPFRVRSVGAVEFLQSAPDPEGARVVDFLRGNELVQSLAFPARPELHPLDVGLIRGGGGLRAGSYELLPVVGERVLSRFTVIEPRGSEASVRAALGRAARLAASGDETNVAQAARLYESVLERYPNTTYVTSIYAGLWRVRGQTRAYAGDPGAWLERIFASFHNTCFGVWALDRFMADVPAGEARPLLRRLVGLYPDTMLSRAAGAYQ